MHCSRKEALLRHGVTTLIRGSLRVSDFVAIMAGSHDRRWPLSLWWLLPTSGLVFRQERRLDGPIQHPPPSETAKRAVDS
jgi:hypothetical protein